MSFRYVVVHYVNRYRIHLESMIVPLRFLSALLLIVIYVYRKWSLKHFGGVTGDLSGAFIEGMEAFLWLVVLRIHLMRHLPTAGNKQRRYIGWTDEPIVEIGQ